ncbi:proline-specific peptidase [Trametes elegans]|nr:proline-specific peptidase [Trametes elegans]
MTSFCESFAPFIYEGETYQTYYKVFSNLEGRSATPVVLLHDGSGLTHQCLVPHADLTARSHPVILYDQIGNGRSTHLPDKPPSFWTVDLFLAEFQHLGIEDDYYNVGHSWGGMMASELIIRSHPRGLRRFVVDGSPADIAVWNRSSKELLEKFPQSVKDALAEGPAADREAYVNALKEVYAVHGCRLQPIPEEFVSTLLNNYLGGMLKGWSIVDQSHTIDVPTIVINERYDIAQDYMVEPYHKEIPGARWIKFEDSSHTPFWEGREEYMSVVGDFLSE